MVSGSRLAPACAEAEICLRTYRRWVKGKIVVADKRPDAIKPTPENKLTEAERITILAICNQPEYASLPPTQIVPKLADKGLYIASESTFYRVLKAHEQVQHRGRANAATKRSKPTSYTATGPNQLWSWDITYCVPGVQGEQGCSNEPRVYLKYANETASAELFASVPGCAGI